MPLDGLLVKLQERAAMQGVETAAKDAHSTLSEAIAEDVQRLIAERAAADKAAAEAGRKTRERAAKKKTGIGRLIARFKSPEQFAAERRSRELTDEIRSVPGVASVIQGQEQRAKEARFRDGLRAAGQSDADVEWTLATGKPSPGTQATIAADVASSREGARLAAQDKHNERTYGPKWREMFQRQMEAEIAKLEADANYTNARAGSPPGSQTQSPYDKKIAEAQAGVVNYYAGAAPDMPQTNSPAEKMIAITNLMRDTDMAEVRRQASEIVAAQFGTTSAEQLQLKNLFQSDSEDFGTISQTIRNLNLKQEEVLPAFRKARLQVMNVDSPQALAHIMATALVTNAYSTDQGIYAALDDFDQVMGTNVMAPGNEAAFAFWLSGVKMHVANLQRAAYAEDPLNVAALTPQIVDNHPFWGNVRDYAEQQILIGFEKFGSIEGINPKNVPDLFPGVFGRKSGGEK